MKKINKGDKTKYLYKVASPIIHNGELLKEGEFIEINEFTARNFEKIGNIVKRKQWCIKDRKEIEKLKYRQIKSK